MKYRIYIDEVGNSDLKSSDDPNHRFLSLTGIIIELDYVKATIFPQLENLKEQFFNSHPDDPIIFHRKELVNQKQNFSILNDHSIRNSFDNSLLNLLKDWDYSVISICIDKMKHKETYGTWRYDPYHYCLALLLERFILFLKSKDTVGDALAESRGGKEDRRLKDSFNRLYENGTDFIPSEDFKTYLTSKQLKVKGKKNNIAGLQLADLIAHPSRNEILKENNLFEKELPIFGKKIIDILQEKYYKKRNRIFGKKFI